MPTLRLVAALENSDFDRLPSRDQSIAIARAYAEIVGLPRKYLAYTARRIEWSIRSGRVLFGRDIAQVMLLHCTRLNADSIDDLASLFRRFRLRPVSLDRAMRDPAYRTPDTVAEKEGMDWLERWAAVKHKDLPEEGDDDPPADIQAAYDRVDNDRR